MRDDVPSGEYPRQESNAPTLSADGASEIAIRLSSSGAQTGAPKPDSDVLMAIDADLAAVVKAWPTLPERTRREICDLLNQAQCDALGTNEPRGA